MTRLQAFLIALSVAFAVAAGTYAAMQTTRLGTGATTHVSPTALADERRALDRTAIALRRALKQRPPKLPPVHRPPSTPRVISVPAPVAPLPAVQRVTAATTTVRPATRTHSSPAPTGDDSHDGKGADD